MLLTLTTTHRPATDLGYLLMKHPDNVHETGLPFGRAIVFFPEASEERCTAALTLEVDPVELVRGKSRGAAALEEQYVTDRPYAASSLLAVALGRTFNTAMGGRSKLRQALADAAIPLEATLTPLPARAGGENLVARLFEPLGYRVETKAIPLDPAHPEWGDSPYVTLTLRGEARLSALLTHLFVLVPVLDAKKHYYIGEDEVEKLLRKGEGWLEAHPERELIVRRYLKNFRSLVRSATARFDVAEPEEAEEAEGRDAGEDAFEKPIRLNDLRMERVLDTLKSLGAASVLDLGCGEGKLIRALLKDRQFQRIVGVEVAPRILAVAADRLRLESMPDLQRKRIELVQGSLVYRDERLKGFDAAAVVEVIEHMEAERLPAFEAALFGHARPGAVLITTPNRDYNGRFEGLAAGAMRHADHRFEWSRAEFAHWAQSVAAAHGYEVRLEGIGAADPELGAPTQMGVFTRC
ncbi:MAG TPA: 3' terminal RNA ribose 2'-O-methyltransferase Hen1 [Allosphingosinicella sp.]|jgi:3' terminal RNA ribose 2'-O-methyltransferase Hen1